MADVIMNSANATSLTENEVILSIVQDELLRAAKLRPTVREFPAEKGDKSVSIPRFTASFAGPAVQNPDGTTNVDFQSIILGVDTIVLDKWTNLPYRVPDRSSLQTKVNIEAEAAKSAGKQMGIYIDDVIIAELRKPSLAAPDHLIDLDGAGVSGFASAITLEGVTQARNLLNKKNLPMDDRFLVIPPDQEKQLLDLDQFRNADKYGARDALLDGEIGRIYGFRVMMHNGLNSNECFAYHKDAIAIAVQREVKFESQRADVRLQATDYSFSLGMGGQVLEGGTKQVRMLGA